MATSESSGQKPQPFEGNTPFVSPIVQNVLKDTVLEETGIRYTTFKTFLPVQPFDVAQRPSRVFEFHLREFTAFLIPNSKFFFLFSPRPSSLRPIYRRFELAVRPFVYPSTALFIRRHVRLSVNPSTIPASNKLFENVLRRHVLSLPSFKSSSWS